MYLYPPSHHYTLYPLYRHCFYYVRTGYWFRLNEATVDVTTDTKDQRNASAGWIIVGSTATGLIAVCALLAWWFQRCIRSLYELAIQKSAVTMPSHAVSQDVPYPVFYFRCYG